MSDSIHEQFPVRILAAVLLALIPCATRAGEGAVAAAGEAEGRKIIRIRIDAPPAADFDRIRETLKVREGDRYSEAAVRRDVSVLYGLGVFRDVRATRRLVAGGVELTYHVVSRPRVAKVVFAVEGKWGVSKTALRDVLAVRTGAPASLFQVKRDLHALRAHLREKGYLFARVRQETSETDEGLAITYRVYFGPLTRIESVRFEGADPVPEGELYKVMASVRRTRFTLSPRYDPVLLRSDLLAVREVLRRKGYLDATVGHEIVFDDVKERAYLRVSASKGRLYHVGSVAIRGTSVFSAEEVSAAMALREGDAFSADQLEEDVRAVTALHGRRGYVRAKVNVRRIVSDAEARVALILEVDEGLACYVRKVLIRGNTRTKDHVIRRDVRLIPGARANTDHVEETKRRLRNTGLFAMEGASGKEAVRVEFLDTESPGHVDVLVEVVEGGLGFVTVGAGYNSSFGVAANLGVTIYNFDALDFPQNWRDLKGLTAWTGGGQKLTLALSPGYYYQDYRLSWSNPSVWDSPYSVGFSVFRRDFGWNEYYDEHRTGGSMTVGRRFFEDLRIALTPRMEWITISDVDDNAPADAKGDKGDYLRNSLTLEVTYDKRDNVFLTTRGYELSASLEMAGVILGGDIDYFKEQFSARKWLTVWDQKTWGKHTVSAGGEAVLMHSAGPGGVPFFDRTFMGGLGTVRGFQYSRAGPIEAASGRQTGGEYRFLGNAEYEAPLLKNYIRGVAFVDAGLLERTFSDLALAQVRVTVGGGLRFRLPQFGTREIPLSLYIAVPLRDESGDKTQPFNISIGSGFAF